MIKYKYISALLFLCLINISSYATWVYTPSTGKWTNPKYETKKTASLQWDHAVQYEKQRDFKKAAKAYIKLYKKFPTNDKAPYSLYNAAQCYEKSNHFMKAFETYQLIVDQYPSYSDLKNVVSNQFKIANLFLEGKRKRFLKIPTLKAYDKAAEYFKKVVENMPFADFSPQSKFNHGLSLEKLDKFLEAIEIYKELIDVYANSPLVVEANFRIAESAYQQSHSEDYDQEATDTAMIYYKRFIDLYPDSSQINISQQRMQELKIRKINGIMNTAEYYEKKSKYNAAKMYYQKIVDLYPGTSYENLAISKIEWINAILSNHKMDKDDHSDE